MKFNIIIFFKVINGGACVPMIELTKLKGGKFALNDEQIETLEETPDTIVAMLNGHRYIVKESMREIISRIEAFRRNSTGPRVL